MQPNLINVFYLVPICFVCAGSRVEISPAYVYFTVEIEKNPGLLAKSGFMISGFLVRVCHVWSLMMCLAALLQLSALVSL